jgi:long-chain acyl-CoA synthetase
MRRSSLVEFLALFEQHGREVAYAQRRGYRTERFSYADVLRRARQFARELEARGIAKGSHVLLWGENCAEWAIAFFGCVLRGAVVVPMDDGAAPDFARRVAQQVGARMLVCSRKHAAFDAAQPALAFEDFRKALARHSAEPFPSPKIERGDTLEILFTSGTTAEPKGVVLTHGNVLANLEPLEEQIRPYLKYERFVHPLRFLNLLPLSHVFGQFLGTLIPPLLGGTVIFLDTLNPAEVIRTIRRERISVLVAVPRLLESLRGKFERDLEAEGKLEEFRRALEKSEGQHFLRRWWRFRRIHRQFGWKFWAFISGGAALDRATEEFWARLGFAVIQGYGLTETTSLVSVNHPFRLGRGSIGKVLAGRDLRLADDGEILVRGEGVAAGYWQSGELEPVAGEDGWFRTGDLGELDAEGNLYFKGRKKNVIVTPEGMNVYPQDLEAALRRQPEVRDCVVLPLGREGNAEPFAVLLLDDAAHAEAALRRANESLADYQRIRRWMVWPEGDFPRTPTHKPNLGAIQRMVERRERGTAESPGGPLAELISQITGRAPGRLAAHADLATDLNLSSIERVELLSALEDRFQVELSDAGFTAATTVGELERLLRAPGQAGAPVPPAEESGYEYPVWPQWRIAAWTRAAAWYLLIVPAMALLGRPRVRGRENLRGVPGPLLLVSNHVTFLDPALVMAGLPARFRHRLAVAMIGERLRAMRHPPRDRGWLLGMVDRVTCFLLLLLFNVFPLPQKSGYRRSFAFAGESADRGYSVLVFPEGGRTRDGRLAPFRAGIGLLANRLGLPIVPVRIDGLFELKQGGKKRAPRGALRISIGEPVEFPPQTEAEKIARELERRVAALAWRE